MKRSKFFRAARKPEWITGNSHRPVDLTDEDPAAFQTYVECVYRGPETIRESPERFERDVRDSITGYHDLYIQNLPPDRTCSAGLEEFTRAISTSLRLHTRTLQDLDRRAAQQSTSAPHTQVAQLAKLLTGAVLTDMRSSWSLLKCPACRPGKNKG